MGFLKTCPTRIRQSFQELTFQAGAVILNQGDPAEYVYILSEGKAGVYQMALNGIEYLAYIYHGDELFGEIEIFNHKPILSNVRANQACKTIRIAKVDFIQWMQAEPGFAFFICQQLAEKLYQTSVNSVTHIAYPLKYRVLSCLWNHFQRGNQYIQKADIIHSLGSNERSVNRILQELVNSRQVESDRGMVKINSIEDIAKQLQEYEK
jgi:CRP-like cAMP-binding protein